ncbi:hypothetical protein GCM10010492_70470 [Saccharothrix mutabilis subsp. mutabilis]|uniref:Insertion element IS402-like domain-containing protein n=1 Tax=Saccharothrix mutabilis subsp. mutabilis TaxID=66855 RepID=A0ABN0URQ4_9PSEU
MPRLGVGPGFAGRPELTNAELGALAGAKALRGFTSDARWLRLPAASVYVLTSGCTWRDLPPSFGVTVPTAHRRFTEWTRAALWRRLHQAVLDKLGSRGEIDWSRAILDAASVRADKRVT